jgi:hypothetical protein
MECSEREMMLLSAESNSEGVGVQYEYQCWYQCSGRPSQWLSKLHYNM